MATTLTQEHAKAREYVLYYSPTQHKDYDEAKEVTLQDGQTHIYTRAEEITGDNPEGKFTSRPPKKIGILYTPNNGKWETTITFNAYTDVAKVATIQATAETKFRKSPKLEPKSQCF